MAYGFGNTVNPQLGATNYSGFLQGALSGAQMQAQGGAAIGQGIAQGLQNFAQGIEKYQKKKEEKETKQASVNLAADMIRENRGLFPGLDPDTPEGMEKIRAGATSVGPAAFLQMVQTLSKAKEDQDAAAYAEQLGQGKGMDYLRGNFMTPFRATPFSKSAQIKGQTIYNEGERASLELEQKRQEIARGKEAQIDKRIEDEARSLAADLDAGFDFDPNTMSVAGFTPQQNNRLFTSPIVMAAMEKQKSKRLGESVASSVSNISSGKSTFADEVKKFNGGDVFTFWKAAQDFVPESLARQINIGGVKGVFFDNKFFASDKGGLDAPAYSNAINAAAAYIRDNGIKETSELLDQDRNVLSQLLFDSLRARNLTSLPIAGEGKDPLDAFVRDIFDRMQSRKGDNGDESKSREPRAGGPTAPRLAPTSANGVFPTAPPPAGQTAQPMGQPTSLAERLRVDVPNPPLNVRMVTPISDVGPVTDSVTGRVFGAIGGPGAPTPENGVFQTGTTALPPEASPSAGDAGTQVDPSPDQDNSFPLRKIATYAGSGGYLAWKAAPKVANAARVLAQQHGPAVGRAVKTLSDFAKKSINQKTILAGGKSLLRKSRTVALALAADEGIGDLITYGARRAAEGAGPEYNRTASEWLAESLALVTTPPIGRPPTRGGLITFGGIEEGRKQEVVSKILDELSVVKNSDDLTDAEKQRSNAFLLELLNNVRSGDVSGVPERFRAL
jgi:hypothetical protein